MAWSDDPVYSATITFIDRAMKKSEVEFGILGGAGGSTEAEARAKVLSVASAMQTISVALVTGTILRAQSDDLQVAPNPVDNPYRTIEDRIRLRLGPVSGDGEVPVYLPAPKAAMLLDDKETVDPANAAIQALLSFLADKAVDFGKRKLTEYLDGIRERGTMRALPVGKTIVVNP